jgi:hypothetical protein
MGAAFLDGLPASMKCETKRKHRSGVVIMGDDWRRVYVQMIDEIMLGVDFLTDDELNFVDSMYDLLQRRLALSDRQRAKLEEINTKTSQHLSR